MKATMRLSEPPLVSVSYCYQIFFASAIPLYASWRGLIAFVAACRARHHHRQGYGEGH